MKAWIVGIAAVSVVGCKTAQSEAQLAAAASKSVTVKTEITCEQDDGDQWVSVGIKSMGAGQAEAYVVKNDTDDGSAKLAKRSAFARPLSMIRLFTATTWRRFV